MKKFQESLSGLAQRIGSKKARTSLSTAEIVVKAMARRERTKTMKLTPHDIWKKILRKAEITDALTIGESLVEVERVLSEDAFWRTKFIYDFPDLVEFVGDELPSWIASGDTLAEPAFRDMPWRRYYYACRRFMRKCAKIVIEIGSRLHTYSNMLRHMALYPTHVTGRLIPGSTFMVAVTLNHRDPERPADPAFMGEQIGQGEMVMTIWEFCKRFVVYNPAEILMPIIDEDDGGPPVDRSSAYWFRRNLQTETNIIQVAIMVTARLDAIVHLGLVQETLDLRNPAGIGPFIAWVNSVNPLIQGPGDNPWLRGAEDRDDFASALSKLQENIVVRNVMRRTFIFDNPKAFDHVKLLTQIGRRPVRDKKSGKYLIGRENAIDSSSAVSPPPFIGKQEGNLEAMTIANTAFRHVVYTDTDTAAKRQQLVLMCLTRENSGNEIDMEIHPETTQFFRVERGRMVVIVGRPGTGQQDNLTRHAVDEGGFFIVPPNTWHRVQNVGNHGEPLKLYTIYSPPHHPPGTHQETKPVEMAEAEIEGELSPEKAAIMLHEHHFTTDRQRRYFAWKAGQLDSAREEVTGTVITETKNE